MEETEEGRMKGRKERGRKRRKQASNQKGTENLIRVNQCDVLYYNPHKHTSVYTVLCGSSLVFSVPPFSLITLQAQHLRAIMAIERRIPTSKKKQTRLFLGKFPRRPASNDDTK